MIAAAPNAPARPTLDHLAICPKVRELLPIQFDHEHQWLKEQVLRDGFTDPILVWYDESIDAEIVADGHNRLSLWEDPDIVAAGIEPPRVERLEFADKDDLLQWVIHRQLARRNVSPEHQSRLRAKRYKLLMKKGTPNPEGRNQHSAHPGLADAGSEEVACHGRQSTAEIIAAEDDVSPRTVHRDVAYDSALDAIRKVNEKWYADYMAGRIKPRPSKQHIILVGKQAPERIGKSIANWRAGRHWDDSGVRPEPTPERIFDCALRLQKNARAAEKVVNQLGLALGCIVDAMGKNNAHSDYCRELLNEIRPRIMDAAEHADEWVKTLRR